MRSNSCERTSGMQKHAVIKPTTADSDAVLRMLPSRLRVGRSVTTPSIVQTVSARGIPDPSLGHLFLPRGLVLPQSSEVAIETGQKELSPVDLDHVVMD